MRTLQPMYNINFENLQQFENLPDIKMQKFLSGKVSQSLIASDSCDSIIESLDYADHVVLNEKYIYTRCFINGSMVCLLI